MGETTMNNNTKEVLSPSHRLTTGISAIKLVLQKYPISLSISTIKEFPV